MNCGDRPAGWRRRSIEMRLVVLSHKPCWVSPDSFSGYATDGGFPFQMQFLSELFDGTLLVLPVRPRPEARGELPLTGRRLEVLPLAMPRGTGFARKAALVPWLLKNGWTIVRTVQAADAVHAPVPGDIGTFGMIAALALRKPLFVRHCGNWGAQRTAAERFWRWIMERCAGGRNVMLATGGSAEAPSRRNPQVGWIFSTTLTEAELADLSAENRYSDGTRLITVSRQEPGKGTDVLIRSLPLVLKKFPDAALDVVGAGSALPEWKRLAGALGVAGRVVFHGAVGHADVLHLLGGAKLFCYPTESEGFPKVVLEALACGLPVITTPVSVLPNLISRGCGLILNERTPEAVAAAVERCLRDPSVHRDMSSKAREVAAEYSLERWRDAIGARLRSQWGLALRTTAVDC